MITSATTAKWTKQLNDNELINRLMNYHRDQVDTMSDPEDRLEKIPFHLQVIEMLARLDDELIRKEKQR